MVDQREDGTLVNQMAGMLTATFAISMATRLQIVGRKRRNKQANMSERLRHKIQYHQKWVMPQQEHSYKPKVPEVF